MQKSKRFLSLALASCMLLTVALAGCGDKDDAESSSSGATSTASSSSAAASATVELPEVELSWIMLCNPPKDLEMVNTELNKVLKEKINATVKLNFLDAAAWKEKTAVMIAAGEYYDIMFTASWLQYRQNVAKGAFLDITDMVDQYAPKIKEMLHPAFFETSKVNGRNYAIPTQKELAHTYGVVYREDIAKKYNMDLTQVKKYADLEPFLQTVKEKEPEMYPLLGYNSINPVILLDFDPVGDSTTPGRLYPNKDTKVIYEYETPEVMDILKVQHKYYNAGYIRKDAATLKDRNPDLKAGKVFATIGSLKPLIEEDFETAYGGDWASVSLTQPFITGNDSQGSMQAISRTSKNPERALMFLELVNTDAAVNNMINYGIENVHYVKKAENVIALKDGATAATSSYFPNIGWMVGNQYLNYYLEGNNTEKWGLYEKFNDTATMSKVLGFDFDAEPVKTEQAAWNNADSEFAAGLGTGTFDPEVYIPKYVAKAKAAGVDKIIAEKQKQLDAWLAAKK